MNVLRKYISFPLIFFIALTIFGGYFLININKYIKKGIDLVGGTLITLDVDFKRAYSDFLEGQTDLLIKLIHSEKLSYKSILSENDLFQIECKEKEDSQKIIDFIIKEKLEFDFSRSNEKIELRLTQNQKEKIVRNALFLNIQALKNRLDPFGAGEILIIEQGERIAIELPNVQNPEEARYLIGKTASLEFKPVIDSANSEDELYKKYDDLIPNGTQIVFDESKKVAYLVSKKASLTGKFLEDAYMGYDQMHANRAVVQFKFNSIGAQKFKDLTRNHCGEQLAVIIDNVVVTAPSVNEEIPGGKGSISGNFTAASAQALATLLKSGSFVAPVKIVEEKIIGPGLGLETIKTGLISCMIGLILLFFATIIVYKISGFFAFIVLLYNLLLSLVGMYLIGATLTLSGIAGLILTIGMAVDASILIFERIREELQSGRSFKNAFEVGFSGAMEVIIDANITHFIIAIVLYKFGLGPLKGFAISMIVGIIATILSGIFLLKGIFNYFINKIGIKSFSI